MFVLYKVSLILILLLLGFNCFSQENELLTSQVNQIKKALENDDSAFIDSMFIEIESRFPRKVLNNEVQYLITKADYLVNFKNSYAESISFGLRAKANLENTENKNLDLKAEVYSLIGSAYSQTGEIEKTIEFREMTLNIYIALKDSINIGKQLSNLSNVYRRNDQEEKSINYSLKSIDIFEKIDKHKYCYIPYNTLCMIYMDKYRADSLLRQLDSAEVFITKFKTLIDPSNIEANFAFFLNKSFIERERGDYQKAITMVDSSTNYIGKKNVNDWRLVHDQRMAIYERKKDLRELSSSARKHFRFVDSLYNVKMNDELEELRLSLETECFLREEKQNQEQAVLKSRSNFWAALLIASTIISILLGMLLLQRYRERKKITEMYTLRQQLLRTQMNPHFTFNTLANIKALITQNKTKDASKYLSTFSNLLRMSLDNSIENDVALNKELDALVLYLELQKVRFKDSFNYTINNSIENTDDYAIPTMLIQPFVENCFKHAFKGIDYLGLIVITIKLNGKKIICEITDNGVGLNKAKRQKSTHTSHSFKATNRRLYLLSTEYETTGKVTIADNKNEKGTTVTINLPYKLD